jgi:hypothetical protein
MDFKGKGELYPVFSFLFDYGQVFVQNPLPLKKKKKKKKCRVRGCFSKCKFCFKVFIFII